MIGKEINHTHTPHAHGTHRLEHEHHAHSPHSHSHAHILPSAGGSLSRVFYWAIGLNLAYVAIEAIFGFTSGSLGLLSDAGHNLSDVASLLIALLAFKASERKPTPRYSYGFGKATVEASLVNAVILYVAVVFIAWESVERLLKPQPVDGAEIAWVAGAGVIINGITAWMLLGRSKGDLNVKGAFMHMAADTLVSVGVVVSGVVIRWTGWYWLDPAVGILIAIMIAVGSWSLLRESLRLTLDGVPASADIDAIGRAIMSVPQVKSFHHLHVWALSTTANALTVHVLVGDASEIDAAISGVRASLSETGIAHSTIEAETSMHTCGASGLDTEG